MIKQLAIVMAAVNIACATTYQSDGSSQNIQALHDAAVDGDIITVPRGTFPWTTPVVITKAITLQGAGSGVTLQLRQNHNITWQNPPPGFLGPCPATAEVTTDTRTRNPSTAIIHDAGMNTLLTVTNASAQLIGIRFTSSNTSGYLIRSGPVLTQDCWFRKL